MSRVSRKNESQSCLVGESSFASEARTLTDSVNPVNFNERPSIRDRTFFNFFRSSISASNRINSSVLLET